MITNFLGIEMYQGHQYLKKEDIYTFVHTVFIYGHNDFHIWMEDSCMVFLWIE
jgi:hypothetical protein